VQTLRGLGADLGISAERVCQLEQQAVDTLHAAATQAPTPSSCGGPPNNGPDCVALTARR
jgi:hypothetical protein